MKNLIQKAILEGIENLQSHHSKLTITIKPGYRKASTRLYCRIYAHEGNCAWNESGIGFKPNTLQLFLDPDKGKNNYIPNWIKINRHGSPIWG